MPDTIVHVNQYKNITRLCLESNRDGFTTEGMFLTRAPDIVIQFVC